MKTKLFAILLVLAAAGCSRSPDSMIAAHAVAIDSNVRCEYSGANLTYTVINGQVFEYSSASPVVAERKPAKVVYAVLDGQVKEYY